MFQRTDGSGLSTPLTITLPWNLVMSARQQIADLCTDLSAIVGETVPDFIKGDLDELTHEGKAIRIRTHIVHGIIIEINAEFISDMLGIFAIGAKVGAAAMKVYLDEMEKHGDTLANMDTKWFDTGLTPKGPAEEQEIRVIVWPDGTWTWADDFDEAEWSWKSDDYALVPYNPAEHR